MTAVKQLAVFVLALAGGVGVCMGCLFGGGWVGRCFSDTHNGWCVGVVIGVLSAMLGFVALSSYLEDRWCLKTFGKHSWELPE